MAAVVTCGCPEGIMIRLILTMPGMYRGLRERLLPTEETIGEMVAAYWANPSVVGARVILGYP
jgi:hypothetical protein